MSVWRSFKAARSIPCAVAIVAVGGRWAVACLFLTLGCVVSAAETRVALVVGNSAYTSKPLANPARDAHLMAEALRGVGFDVVEQTDVTEADMKRAVIEFGRRLREPDAVGLFYYAGHGVQVNGENYLIPVGADISELEEVALNSVSLGELMQVMERSDSRLNIVVLDACRDNPFRSQVRSSAAGLAPVEAPSGTLIAYATAPGKVAYDGQGEHSPYTSALAGAIPAEGASIEEVFRRTRRVVLEVTQGRQTPWEHSSLTGEFQFRPKAPAPIDSARANDQSGHLADQRVTEILDWEKVRNSADVAVLRKHIETYPDGLFAELAALRIAKLEEKPASPWTSILTGGTGTPPEPSEAERLYEEALKIDSPTAVEGDLVKALALYRQAADQGLPAAIHSVARAYDKGRGVPRDLEAAAKLYREAADRGHAPAMAALGTMYEFGEGVEADLAEALQLYRQAAERDDASAMTSLGYLYAEGKGVARDAVEGRRWYLMAAEREQPRAMYNLALMCLRGDGGKVDVAEAVRLLDRAGARGHHSALRELAVLADTGRGMARDADKAADLFLSAFRVGDAAQRAEMLRRPESWSRELRLEVQRRLADVGLYDGRRHGAFDARTRRALDRYALAG